MTSLEHFKPNKRVIAGVLLSVLFGASVVGCGGSSSSKSSGNDKGSNSRSSTEISPIAASQVDARVKASAAKIANAKFTFGTESKQLSHLDIEGGEMITYVEGSEGLIVTDWNTRTQRPEGSITVFMGDIPINLEKLTESPYVDNIDIYRADSMMITENGEEMIVTSVVGDALGAAYDVKLVLHEELTGAGNSEITIKGNRAHLNGGLGFRAYIQIQDLIEEHPEVEVLQLDQVPGSVNDEINTYTGRLVRQAGIETFVPANGEIASGGVDLFAAGIKRTVEVGARVGVHSWCCEDGKGASKLPKDHSAHRFQVNYHTEMLGSDIGRDFYFYTIEAADFEDVHWMSPAELSKWLLTSETL